MAYKLWCHTNGFCNYVSCDVANVLLNYLVSTWKQIRPLANSQNESCTVGKRIALSFTNSLPTSTTVFSIAEVITSSHDLMLSAGGNLLSSCGYLLLKVTVTTDHFILL